MEMKPTEEQSAVIEAARGLGNLVIQAGAGTGKTSTLEMVSAQLPSRSLYVAYNKSIATDASQRFPVHVTCKTSHSLAFAAVGRNFSKRLNSGRRPSWEVAKDLGLGFITIGRDISVNPSHQARIAADTVRRFCYSADDEVTREHVPFQNGISGRDHNELVARVLPVAKLWWDDVNDVNGSLPFEHDCQPPGTLVRRVVQRGGWPHGSVAWEDVPIEQIREGDRVVSFTMTQRRGYVRRDGRLVTAAGFRDYSGDLITVTTERGRRSSYTDTHKCVVRLDCDLAEGNHIVYLARRGDDYRVGRTTWRTRSQGNALGIRRRAESQKAEAMWILSVHSTDAEAALEEALISHRWRIPTWQFQSINETMPLRAFWSKVGNNVADARACLAAHGLGVEHPFWQRGAGWGSSRRPVVLRAQNLLSGMLVLEPDEVKPCGQGELHAFEASGGWSPITVTRSPYDGPVYSLDVDIDHTYVADGIVTHNCYFKMWTLTDPKLPFDVVYLDEAQDTNSALAKVILNQDHAQQIVVGDGCQQLYAWRGAVDAMKDWPDAQQLYLSQSWRFGQDIAEEANKWLLLLPTQLELKGNPDRASYLDTLEWPRGVLCRTNAGAIGAVLDALDNDQSVALVGGGQALARLAKAAEDLRNGKRTSHPELFAFSDWEEVARYAREEASGRDLLPLVNLIEEHGTKRIIEATEALVGEEAAEVVVSTVHKAKGREWDTVKVTDDFFAPQPQEGEPPTLSDAEAMVGYVAVTRAKHVLDREGLAWIDDLVDTPVPEEAVADVNVDEQNELDVMGAHGDPDR